MTAAGEAMALSWTLDKIGPICRSAEDCGLVLHELAGGDPDDPGSAGKGLQLRAAVRAQNRLTSRWASRPWISKDCPSSDARASLQAALDGIKQLGFKMKEVELPDFPYGALVSTIIAGEAGSIFEDFIRSGKKWISWTGPEPDCGFEPAMLDLPTTEYLRERCVCARWCKMSFASCS